MRTHSAITTLSLLAISAAGSIHAASPTFAARTELPLGSVVTSGDYNGDGIADLIAAVATSTGDYQITVQISNGTGGFTQGPTVDLGPGFAPSAIAAADFNGDGKLDIAVLAGSTFGATATLYVAIQHAGGFLITPIQLPEEISTLANIAIGDLNGDKQPDIIIPTYSGVTFLLNAGGGKFKTPEFASTTSSTYAAVADVNGDKHQDLLVVVTGTCCSSLINVILGDGHGGFYEPGSQPTVGVSKFAIGDLNGDGKLDIAAVNQGDALELLPGNGDGTFGSPETISLPSPYSIAVNVAAADFNGDGSVDLAVLAESDYSGPQSALLVYPNQGAGVFTASTPYSIPGNSMNMIVSKLTTATSPDILLTPVSPGFDALLLNKGKGIFANGSTFATPVTPLYLISGDFNNDGRNDLAGVNSSGLTVYLNSGNTTILKAETSLPFYTGPLVAGDFNGDGRLDLVDVNDESANMLLGAGGGSFVLKPPSINLGSTASAIAAADINGDGKLDLVTSAATVILGNGDGTFQAPNTDPDQYCYSYSQSETVAVVADFNRDGKPDLLALCGGYISIFLNNGTNTFGIPNIELYTDALGVAVGDFNKDGIPDFAYTVGFYSPTTTETSVYIELGTGSGTFTSGPTIQIPGNATQLVSADFNGDGNLDLAALDNTDAAIIVLPGKGDGTFQNPLAFGTGSDPQCLLSVPLHDPARPEFLDLLTCSAPGISIDYNVAR